MVIMGIKDYVHLGHDLNKVLKSIIRFDYSHSLMNCQSGLGSRHELLIIFINKTGRDTDN